MWLLVIICDLVTDRIVNLEKKLFETQSRNDGLRNSLEQVEYKVR